MFDLDCLSVNWCILFVLMEVECELECVRFVLLLDLLSGVFIFVWEWLIDDCLKIGLYDVLDFWA